MWSLDTCPRRRRLVGDWSLYFRWAGRASSWADPRGDRHRIPTLRRSV